MGRAQGSLHPAGSLYEKPVNTRVSIEEHRAFVKVLEENGAARVCARVRARPATGFTAGIYAEADAASSLPRAERSPGCGGGWGR